MRSRFRIASREAISEMHQKVLQSAIAQSSPSSIRLKVKNIIPEGFAERLIAHGTRSAADALAQQIGAGIELSGRRKDGSQFPIEITRGIHGSRRSRFIYPESLPVAGLKAAPRATIPPSTSQFLIGTSAIRNRRNLMKLNGGLPF
jgi:hypothetical protein